MGRQKSGDNYPRDEIVKFIAAIENRRSNCCDKIVCNTDIYDESSKVVVASPVHALLAGLGDEISSWWEVAVTGS